MMPQAAEPNCANTGYTGSASLPDAPAILIGEAASWFRLERDGPDIVVQPQRPLPRRCTIRPAALFAHDRGFVDANIVMGRLVYPNAASQPQRYGPFTRDPSRSFRELYFPVETMPEDDRPASRQRWSNCQAIAKRLLQAADVPWTGLTDQDIDQFFTFLNWPEPLDACILHALTQWTHDRGRCIIEIGSYRGNSLSVMATALRAAGSNSPLISIDPHDDQPCNRELVRVALRQFGQESRLVQWICPSDDAHTCLAPGIASLVFIDGDHSYEQVAADFQNYLDLLAAGGCLLFHDYGCGDHNARPDTHPGVRRAVDQHVFPHPDLRPLLLAHTLMAFTKHR